MDRSAEFEMPSPKRIRLQASEIEGAIDATLQVDDIGDPYGPPPMQPSSPSGNSRVPALALSKSAFATGQKLFQLPGLGTFTGDPASSFQTLQHQSHPPSFSEAEQSLTTGNVKHVEPEDEQELQVNGGLNAAIDDERLVTMHTTESDDISPATSEIVLDGFPTGIAEYDQQVSEAETPVAGEVTYSRSNIAQDDLEWHSSGTVVDRRGWLHGNCSTENLQPFVPNSNIARITHAEVLEDTGFGQDGENGQDESFSGAKPVVEQCKKTISTDFNEVAEGNKNNEEAEFELDSSPLGSDSSSDDSIDSSSSDDSDVDGYEMLSPAEQARRLMAEDGGSENNAKGKASSVVSEVPRTLNEKPDELVPKPTVAVTEDMKIEELGIVENMVENLAVIKANISGEYQVLESGSLLCLQNRVVVGVVSETLGRVQQPYYSVRFTNAKAIAEAGIEKNTRIFYVAQYSSTVFTQPLKAFKGSDASNLHDEEVGAEELEFSDDEAEAEHKRQVKQQRMLKHSSRDDQPNGFSREPQRPSAPDLCLSGGLHPVQEHPPNSAEAALNYDDVDGKIADDKEDEDGPYTPLRRPSNLHEMLSGRAPPMDNHARRGNTNRSRGGTRGGTRGRGDNRGRGSNRGMRDSERGGKQSRKDLGNRAGKGQKNGCPSPPMSRTNGFAPAQTNALPPHPPPETIGYPQSSHQTNSFPQPPPQQSPVPSPNYQTQQRPQSHTHPDYLSQYPNAYNQSLCQQPPNQFYPSHGPQQNYSQYHQPQQTISHQGFLQQFASQQDMSFPPRPQYQPSIPPGAHINPNLFRQQTQPSTPQGWQQGHNQQQQQQVPPSSDSMGQAAPVSNAARLQELLRGLNRGGQ